MDMTSIVVKFTVTSALVVFVSEISKKSVFIGGLLASLPMVSFLSFIWLYKDTKDLEKVAGLSISIFWLVLPSLAFFPLFWALLKQKLNFWASLSAATVVMMGLYFLMVMMAKKLGYRL